MDGGVGCARERQDDMHVADLGGHMGVHAVDLSFLISLKLFSKKLENIKRD